MAHARMVTGWILGSLGVPLTGLIAFLLATDRADLISDVGPALQVAGAWVLALAGAAGYSAYTLRAVPFVNEHRFELSPLKLLGIWAGVAAAIVEELIFRQALMDLLAGWGTHVVLQILISAVAFGAAHTTWVLLRGDVRIALPVVTSTTILGGLLALVYVVAERNVLPAIAAHALINVAIEPWLILGAVAGNPGKAKPRKSATHPDPRAA